MNIQRHNYISFREETRQPQTEQNNTTFIQSHLELTSRCIVDSSPKTATPLDIQRRLEARSTGKLTDKEMEDIKDSWTTVQSTSDDKSLLKQQQSGIWIRRLAALGYKYQAVECRALRQTSDSYVSTLDDAIPENATFNPESLSRLQLVPTFNYRFSHRSVTSRELRSVTCLGTVSLKAITTSAASASVAMTDEREAKEHKQVVQPSSASSSSVTALTSTKAAELFGSSQRRPTITYRAILKDKTELT
jgi:hypothetical protein